MKADRRAERAAARRLEVYEVAYEVLAEKGYKSASLLAIAKAAKASNETLYNWFGNKQGLLAAMIEENAKSSAHALEQAIAAEMPLREALAGFGPVLLTLITSERAAVLNRAAAADVAQGGTLGALLERHGRSRIKGLVRQLLERAASRGEIEIADGAVLGELYLAALIG
ncbi:MAG: TetR/AcrR family transcriptional regulator, partial [Neomegalonema sp.]|nr:TetR/AcrR family transcriptional regulator [Neomegalonema sp.]